MTEITLKFKDLCKFIPFEWQDECKARSINCMTPDFYPYTQEQLSMCVSTFNEKYPAQPDNIIAFPVSFEENLERLTFLRKAKMMEMLD